MCLAWLPSCDEGREVQRISMAESCQALILVRRADQTRSADIVIVPFSRKFWLLQIHHLYNPLSRRHIQIAQSFLISYSVWLTTDCSWISDVTGATRNRFSARPLQSWGSHTRPFRSRGSSLNRALWWYLRRMWSQALGMWKDGGLVHYIFTSNCNDLIGRGLKLGNKL